PCPRQSRVSCAPRTISSAWPTGPGPECEPLHNHGRAQVAKGGSYPHRDAISGGYRLVDHRSALGHSGGRVRPQAHVRCSPGSCEIQPESVPGWTARRAQGYPTPSRHGSPSSTAHSGEMNYGHAFHAGSFADVFKHAVLARILVHLRAKPAAFRVIDTHAGAGRYDLTGPEASRGGEWRDGIGRLLGAAIGEEARALFAPYLDAVAACNGGGRLTAHPPPPAPGP